MLNVPVLADRLAIRATFYDRHESGWIDDIARDDIALAQPAGQHLNWEHTWGSRESALFAVSDRWHITDILYYKKMLTGNSFEMYPSFATANNPYVSAAFVRTPWDDTSAMANLISTYDLG
jgi:hypothetical protein